MSALAELTIGGMVLLLLVGVYFLLSCRVPVVADPPPGSEPERVTSMARLGIGLACIATVIVGVFLVIAGAGLGQLASH